MLVVRLVRFFLGYVSFRACGGFAERFINLCRLNGVSLWNLRCRDSVITACTDCRGYKKIRAAARKSGMRVRMQGKHGLPFFAERHSRRIGLVIGACLCASVVIILSTRIWSIDVVGNKRIPSETITAVFEELGVKKGASASRLDIGLTEIEAQKRLDGIAWLNMNISGSAVMIEVRETVESPEIDEDKTTPTDIVAARDGQIVILRPFNGTAEQITGTSVLKGDLLISGIEENGDKTVSFCRASGYVVARTTRKISTSSETVFKTYEAVGQKNSYILDFIFFSVPIGRQYDGAYKEKSGITINGVTLPVALTKCRKTDYEEAEKKLSENQAKQLALHRFLGECAETFRYMQVETYKIKQENGLITGEFTCLENIGKEQLMQIEETNP